MTQEAASEADRARCLELAVVQLSSQDDVGANLKECERWIAAAAARRAELVLLPENFAFMSDDKARSARAESLTGPRGQILGTLGELARRYQVHLVAGGMPERSEDPARPFNTSVVFDAAGEIVASYRKVHLFDVDLADGTSARESAGSTPGSVARVVSIGGFNVGLSICYDLRFPELYRQLVSAGAEILLIPAAFTLHTGKDHWHVLLRARAIESQCYVAAAAQWGKHPFGRSTYGHSLIADPWGTVTSEASDGPGFALSTIDAGRIASVRQSLPALRHRRL